MHIYRFEQKGSENIVGHSRHIENSVRREENKRKEKRQRKKVTSRVCT